MILSVKKIIAFVACAVLIIAAIVLGYGKTEVYVGRGNGTDAKVTTIDELDDVFDSIAYLESGFGGASASTYADGQQEEQSPAYHTSVTVTETSEIYYNQKVSMDNPLTGKYYSENTSSANRKLTLYLTPDANYYVSEGEIVSSTYVSSSGEDEEDTERRTRTYLNFKINIYISTEKVMLKIDRLSYTTSGDTESDESEFEFFDVFNRHLGTWIDCSSVPEVMLAFIQLNSQNADTLTEIGDLIKENTQGEQSGFIKEGDIYTLDEEIIKEFFGASTVGDEFFDGSFIIDLSAAERPSLNYDVKVDVKDEENTGNASYAYLSDGIIFENIDNTRVSLGEVDTVDIQDIMPETEG